MASSHQEAADAVGRYAFERNRHNVGCVVLSGFIPHESLRQFLQGAYSPDSRLTGRELSAHLANYFQKQDLSRYLVVALLEDFASRIGDKQEIASRILDQIRLDQTTSPTFRKPAHYFGGTDEGLAIAIAIDDRFWTDAW